MRTEFRAERRPISDRVDLFAFHRLDDGRVGFAQPLVVEVLGPGVVGTAPHPIASLSMDDAQTLIDELWRAGLRPTEGTGSAGSLAATERHLKDMQAIALGMLRKDGVQV